MNGLSEHYTSYRTSLEKDLLEGAVDYSKTLITATPKEYPTIYDYLRKAAVGIKAAIGFGNLAEYSTWLEGHQKAMLGVLERYVQETRLDPLDLIHQRGWRWFRFAQEQVFLDDFSLTWTPRFTGKERGATLDAEELELIFKRKDPVLARHCLGVKRAAICKLFPVNGSEFKAELIPTINKGTVRDWTMRLF